MNCVIISGVEPYDMTLHFNSHMPIMWQVTTTSKCWSLLLTD